MIYSTNKLGGMNYFYFFEIACPNEYPFALDETFSRDKCSDAADWFPSPPEPEIDENGNPKDRMNKANLINNKNTIPCPHFPTPCSDAAGEWV